MLISAVILAGSFAVALPPQTGSVAEVATKKSADPAPEAEPTFIEKYYPTEYGALAPEVEEQKTTAHILMVVAAPCFGPIWVPMVMYGGSPGDYFSESVVSWLVHAAAGCIPGIGGAIALANCFYLSPLAATILWDANQKLESGNNGRKKASRTDKPSFVQPVARMKQPAEPAMLF